MPHCRISYFNVRNFRGKKLSWEETFAVGKNREIFVFSREETFTVEDILRSSRE